MVLHHEHHFILALGKTPRVCKALLYMFPSFSPARVGIPIKQLEFLTKIFKVKYIYKQFVVKTLCYMLKRLKNII